MPPKKRRGSGWERRPTSKDTLFGQLPPPEEVRAPLVAAGGTTHRLTGRRVALAGADRGATSRNPLAGYPNAAERGAPLTAV